METLHVFDLYRNVFDLYKQKYYVLWHNNIIFILRRPKTDLFITKNLG